MAEDLSNRESPNLAKSMKRSNKPLMEKRRRGRINSSLDELKALVLEALNRDTSQYSKLEKADILEMTVKHLKHVQRQQLTIAAAADTTVATKYRAGFTECAHEVNKYLTQVDGLDSPTRSRLLRHLNNCMQHLHGDQQQQQQQQQHAIHVPIATHHPQAAALQQQHQLPVGTSLSALPGTPMNMNGVPVIPAFSLNQLQVLGGLVIPGSSFSGQQQQQVQLLQPHQPQQQAHPSSSASNSRRAANNTCQFRDLNNNDVTPMPSLMGKHTGSRDVQLASPTYSSMSSSASSRSSVTSSSPSPPSSPCGTPEMQLHAYNYSLQAASSHKLQQQAQLQQQEEDRHRQQAPSPVVIAPRPQADNMWRPWSSEAPLLVH